MRTRDSETAPVTTGNDVGVGEAAKQVVDHAKALVGLEVELAKVEVGRKAAAFGAGAALLAVAAVTALYALGFLLATVAAALDTFMPRWLSLLVVGLALLLIAVVAAMVGIKRLRRGSPPTPEQAIREAKLTTTALKGDGRA
jgi:uncharacterized membrane protein YqjE